MEDAKMNGIGIESIEREEEERHSSFWRIVLGLFLIFIVIVLTIPITKFKVDPEPKHIMYEQISEMVHFKPNNDSARIIDESSIRNMFMPSDATIKETSNLITNLACEGQTRQLRVCQAKALFYFVRDNFDYVNDPKTSEYLASPLQTLFTRSGDCDDLTTLLANLESAIGLNTRLVFIPNHVYLQIQLPEALKSYKQEGDWVSLDPTCKNCNFGQVTYEVEKANKRYLDLV